MLPIPLTSDWSRRHRFTALERDFMRTTTARSFQAGPDGVELLAFGAGEKGDAEMIQDFW